MPYTSDSWTFGHVPTTFKRLPTVNRWGVLHGFYSDQRDDQELSNSAPDMPSGVGFRILANRNIWRFPNSTSIHNLYYYNDGPEIQGGAAIVRHSNYTAFDPKTTTTKASFGVVNFDLSRSSSLYKSNLNEVRVNALFGMSLIRAY